jgi:hypothetical protein
MARSRLFRLAGSGLLVLLFGGCVSANRNALPISRDTPLGLAPTVAEADAEEETTLVARSQRPDSEAPALPVPSAAKQPAAPALPTPGSLTSSLPGIPADGKLRVSVRAWVNGQPVFDEEVTNAVLQMHGHQLRDLPEPQRSTFMAKVFNEELNQMIERELILQDAYRKLKDNPKFLEKLRAAARKHADKKLADIAKLNKSTIEQIKATMGGKEMLENFRRQQERNFIAQEYIRSRVQPYLAQVSRGDIEGYYAQHANEFRTFDKVKWQDIFIALPNHPVPGEALHIAENILERVKRGESFENCLKQDEGDSWKYRQGEGRGQLRHEIQPHELEKYLFQMKEGEVGPLVELSTGYHVFRLLKREVAGAMPFDNAMQLRITNKLRAEVADREYKRIVKELKERAIIVIERSAPK